MYGKLFASLYSGSMVGSGPLCFAVWGYVIASKDEDGYAELNPILIAAAIGQCTPEDIQDCLSRFCEPDPRSRSTEEDGRRLVKEGEYLYRVVNAKAYDSIVKRADKKTYMRKYMHEKRVIQDNSSCKNSVNSMLENPSMSISTCTSFLGVKEECEKEKGEDPVRRIFARWNSYSGRVVEKQGRRVVWHGHVKLSAEIVRGVQARLKEYSVEELSAAVDNYASILLDVKSYWSYTWAMPEFFTRKQSKERDAPLQILRFLPDNFHPDQFFLGRDNERTSPATTQQQHNRDYDGLASKYGTVIHV